VVVARSRLNAEGLACQRSFRERLALGNVPVLSLLSADQLPGGLCMAASRARGLADGLLQSLPWRIRYSSKVQQRRRRSAAISEPSTHTARLGDAQSGEGRHFASKGLGFESPWLHYSPLSEGISWPMGAGWICKYSNKHSQGSTGVTPIYAGPLPISLGHRPHDLQHDIGLMTATATAHGRHSPAPPREEVACLSPTAPLSGH
jgi:hypothetical protein